MEEESARAKASPSYLNSFLTYHLNRWVSQESRWIDPTRWEECKRDIDLEQLRGRECYVGVNFSSVSDLTAAVLIFPNEDRSYTVIPHFLVPRETAKQKSLGASGADYITWAREGHVTISSGRAIDQKEIIAKISQWHEQYDVKELAFDPYNSWRTIQDLEEAGYVVVSVRQGVSLNAPSKHFEECVLKQTIHHNGNPCLAWNVANVTLKRDHQGNIWPDKTKREEKIDGVAALITGLSRAMLMASERERYTLGQPITLGYYRTGRTMNAVGGWST